MGPRAGPVVLWKDLQEQLNGAQSRFGSFVEENNLFLLSGFEPCSLASIPTELSRLRIKSILQ